MTLVNIDTLENFLFFELSLQFVALPRKLQYSSNILPVHLPTTCDLSKNIDAVVMRHGMTADNTNISMQSNFALLKIVPLNICQHTFSFHDRNHPFICAENAINGQ